MGWAHCPPGAKLRVDAFFFSRQLFFSKIFKIQFWWGGGLQDYADPDPADIEFWILRFKGRLKTLFIEGAIMQSVDTFTGQILEFLKHPSVIFAKKHAVLFHLPTNSVEYYAPLERARAVVRTILIAIDAAFPPTCWQRLFSAYHLPNPLGRSGKTLDGKTTYQPAQKEIFTRKLMSLFTGAGLQDPRGTIDEMMSIEPAAVVALGQGFTLRQAWGHASAMYPEKKKARKAVELLLVNTPCTGNIERGLKRLAAIELRKSNSDFCEDTFLCDAHGPKRQDVFEEYEVSVPKNKYPATIIRCYRACFGVREWKRAPRRHRDFGTAVPSRGRPGSLAGDLRRRAAEVKRLLNATPEARAAAMPRLRRRFGAVPADTHKYDTPALKAHRADILSRGKSKQQRLGGRSAAGGAVETPKKKAKTPAAVTPPRWIDKPSPAVAPPPPKRRRVSSAACSRANKQAKTGHGAGGETSAAGMKTSAPHPRPPAGTCFAICFAGKVGEGVEDVFVRRGYLVMVTWEAAMTAVLVKKNVKPNNLVVALADLEPTSLHRDPFAVVCRCLGGFLTSTAWLDAGLKEKAPPSGIQFRGLRGGRSAAALEIAISPKFVLDHPSETAVLIAISKHSPNALKLVEVRALARAVGAYVKERGPKSQPSCRFAFLVVDEADRKQISKSVDSAAGGPKLKKVSQDWKAFLDNRCPVVRGAVCPGPWRF